jgi:lipopolysaccharide export system protein LptA
MIKVNPAYLLLLLLPIQAWAMESDRAQPISVEADSLEVRENDNISIYTGNVHLVQGSLRANAQRMVVLFSDERELVSIEMTGKPADFRQLDNQQREMLGHALRIDYTESGSLLVLTGDAFYQHAGDTIDSELIQVNTDTSHVQAHGNETDQRVKMLIQPKQE